MAAEDNGSTGSGGSGAPSPTRHIKRVLVAVGIVIAAGLVARAVAVPATFGEHGHYRYRYAAEIEARDVYPTSHLGEAKCAECHDEEAELHAKDVHVAVQCETCHGPGAVHVREQDEGVEPPPGVTPIIVPRTQDACLTCHRRLLARPAPFPQINVDEHFALLGVVKKDTACSECHSPHEPLFVEKSVSEARLHPVISECASCHKEKRDEAMERPATHPLIFKCDYCHPAIADDFSGRAHADNGCGSCHQYYPVSERGGRILKHRDPRFCLLCHTARDFKGDAAPPGIEWPAHREEMSSGPEDATKVCADCHRDAFHLSPVALGGEGNGGQR